MIVYRISKNKFAHDLSGKGAELAGGRWNSKGRAMVYTSGSVALCIAEVAVHLPLGRLPKNYALARIVIPDDGIKQFNEQQLPEDWNSLLHAHATQSIGDQFLEESDQLILRVPSAIVPMEYNYLINPIHPRIQDVALVDVQPFNFDKRLFLRPIKD